MRLRHSWIAVLPMLAVACSGSSQEPTQPPAATAAGGAEQPPTAPAPTPPPAVSAPTPPPATETPAPAPASVASNTAVPEAPQMPQLAAVVIHEVKDFDSWKKVFDEHQPARREAGMVGEGILRGADNDKIVGIYAPASDAAKLKAFLESKDLKEKMKSAGVKGKPTIYVFNNAGAKMAPAEKTGLFGAIVAASVKDFAAFKTAIEAEGETRAAANVIGYGLGQGVDKPSDALLYLQGEDLTQLKAYLGSKDTKKAWKDAGVSGQPKIAYFKEGAVTMYPK